MQRAKKTKNEKKKYKVLFRGDSFTFYSSNSQDVDEQKNILFDKIQNLPAVENCPDDIETKILFKQENALGVRQKGIIVVSPNKGKYSVAGTNELYSCLGMSFYSPKNKKLVVTHIDITPYIQRLDQILDEFDPGEIVEVRVFGGLGPGKYDKGHVNEQSIQNAKEVFWYLCKSKHLTFNFLTANIFKTLHEHRMRCFKKKLSTNIGFAVNSANGKVFLFPRSIFKKERLPYMVEFENCGLFSGPYNNDHVHVAFLQYLGFSKGLFKHYDAFKENWEEEYPAQLEHLTRKIIPNVIFTGLEKKGYIYEESLMKNAIMHFLEHSLTKLHEDSEFHDVSWCELLLQKCAFDEMTKKSEYKEFLKKNGLELTKVFLIQVIENPLLINWCKSTCRFYIVQIIGKLREEPMETPHEKFLSELNRNLKKIIGSEALLKSFVRFEKSLAYQGYRGTKEETLLSRLVTCSIEEISDIIAGWRQSEIKASIEKFSSNLINFACEHQMEIVPYRSILAAFIIKVFKRNIQNISFTEEINLDSLCYGSEHLNKLYNKIFLLLCGKTYVTSFSFFYCSTIQEEVPKVFNLEHTKIKIKHYINKWCKNYLLNEEVLFEVDESELIPFLNVDLNSEKDKPNNKGKDKKNKKENEESNKKKNKKKKKGREKKEKKSEQPSFTPFNH
jgi:hypothetical protein